MQNQSKVAKSQLMGNLFVLITSNLYEFALFSQTSNFEKSNIQTLHCRLGHLYVNNIMKLILMLSGLEMLESINNFFCKTCVLGKQVKHIFKILVIRAEIPREIIHTDLFGPITLTGYEKSKYGLLLTDDATLQQQACFPRKKVR